MDLFLAKKLKAPYVPDVEDDEWEKNFDDEYINEKIRKSDINPVRIDPNFIDEF